MMIRAVFTLFARRIQRSFPRVLGGKVVKSSDPLIERYHDRLFVAGTIAAHASYAKGKKMGLVVPKAHAEAASVLAMVREQKKFLTAIADRGQAERELIRAKYGVKLATLKLHQATRDHGTGSPEAAKAQQALAAAQQAESLGQRRVAANPLNY